MAEDIKQRIIFDDSQLISSMKTQLDLTNKVAAAIKGTEDAYKSLGDTATKEVDESNKVIEDGTKTINANIEATNKAKASSSGWKQVLGDLADEVNILGVNLGGVIDNLKAKATAMKSVASSVGGVSSAMKVLKVALISSGIGAIVVALGSLVALLTKTEQGTNKVSQVMAGLGAAMNVILDRMVKVGGALVKVFKGDFLGAFQDAKASVSGLTDELVRETKAAVALEKEMQKLKDRIRDLSKEQATRAVEISKQELIASDQTKKHTERIEALTEANRLKGITDQENLEIKQKEYDAIVKSNEARAEGLKDLDGEAAAFVALENARKEANENQETNNRKITGMEQQLREERAAAHAERMAQITAANEALQSQIDKIASAYEKVELSKLSPTDRIHAETEIAHKIVEEQFKLLEELAKAAGKQIDLTKEKAAIQQSIEDDKIKAIQALREKDLKAVADIEDLGEKGRRERAEAAQKDIKDGAKEQTEILLSPWEALEKKVSEALGLTVSQFRDTLAGLGDIVNSAFELIGSVNEKAIAENEEILNGIRERQDLLDEDLEKEKERAALGLANKLEIKDKEREALAKEEAAALKDQDKLRKKQLAQQLLQDALQQGSSIATMATNVTANASLLGPAGIPVAIATIAAFIGMIAKIRSSTKKLYKGGPIDQEGVTGFVNKSGRSDKNGGRGHQVEDSNLVLGGKEFVVNEATAMKHSAFLEALNRGEFDNSDGLHFAMGHGKELDHGMAIDAALTERRNSQGIAAAMGSMFEASIHKSIGKLIGVIEDKPDVVAYSPGDIIRKESKGKITITETEKDWRWKPEPRG